MVDRQNVFSEMTNSLVVLSQGLGRELTVPDAVTWLASRDEHLFQSDLLSFAEHRWAYLEENKVMRATEVSFRSYCSRTNAKFWTLCVQDDDADRKRIVLSDDGHALLLKLREKLEQEYRTISIDDWNDRIADETLHSSHEETISNMLVEVSNVRVDDEANDARGESQVLTGGVPVREVGWTVRSTTNGRQSLFHHLVEARTTLHSDMGMQFGHHTKNVYVHYYHPNKTIRVISPYMQVIARAIEYSSREAIGIHRQEVSIRKNGSFMMSDARILEALSLHFKCSGEQLLEKMKFYEEIGKALDYSKNVPSYMKYMELICEEVNQASKLLSAMQSECTCSIQNLNNLQHFMRYMSGVKTHMDTFMHAMITDQVLNCMRAERDTSVKLFERMAGFVNTYEDN